MIAETRTMKRIMWERNLENTGPVLLAVRERKEVVEEKRRDIIDRIYTVANALRIGQYAGEAPEWVLWSMMEMSADSLFRIADELGNLDRKNA